MKMKSYHPLIIAIGLYLAIVAQVSIAPAVAPFGCVPDFLLLALGLFSMRGGRLSGAMIGFFAGILYGGVAGANIQLYVFSRVIAGLLIGSVSSMELDSSFLLASIVSVFTVLIGQGIMILLAPHPNLIGLVGATIETAVYNGVLAIPVYALLKRIQGPAMH